jgi:hypothetical protein
VEQLRAHYSNHPAREFWENLLDIEVNGQLKFFVEKGCFVEDQRAFTIQKLEERGFIL